MSKINIIKIDIEGGEQYIKEGLKYISAFAGITVLLSIHTPFWKSKEETIKMLLETLTAFEVYTDKEDKIDETLLKNMLQEEQETPYKNLVGVFFTIILKTKQK